MRILFLDIASHEGLLACSTEERVVVHRTIDHRIGDHELVPLIDEALREANWSYGDLTHLACVIGPGGFTSLRVGVSCINTLSWSLKIPVAGVHLSDLYAARMPEGEGQGMGAIWLHSTKRTELFVRGFGDFAKEWPQPTHVDLPSFLSTAATIPESSLRWIGELLPEHESVIEAAGIQRQGSIPVEHFLPQFLASCEYRERVLQPWYGRGW